MKCLLVMNPGARAGRGKRRWKLWEVGLCESGVDFDAVRTERPGHAFELARAASGYDVVVAVGGDGTVNEVIDGVVQAGNNDLKMGVLYAGTSPDFCKFHGVSTDPREALRLLVAGKLKKVDVARIAYHDAKGVERLGHFGCSCNIGMGAAVARTSNACRKYIGDKWGSAVAVARALMANRVADLELEIDGQAVSLPRTNNLSVAKNPHIASGLKLNLDLLPDDGRMWLVGVHGKNRLGLWKTLPSFYTGSVTSSPGTFLVSCRSVLVRSPEPREIEFDGDPRGYLPVHIEILPKALNLIGAEHE